MNDDAVSTPASPPPPLENPLLRRNRTSSSPPNSDFELMSIKPVSYISLKDLLPISTVVNSPRPVTAHQAQSPRSDISIRNRLVKQAACAYLHPMSQSPDSAARGFLRRVLDHHIFRALTRAFAWLMRAIRVRSSR